MYSREPNWSTYNDIPRDMNFDTHLAALTLEVQDIHNNIEDVCKIYKYICDHPIDPSDPIR